MGRKMTLARKANMGGVGQQVYEAKTGVEALKRAGRNPQLKGIVHEMMYRDKLNAKAIARFSKEKAVLSKSSTALRDDILIKRGTKVVGRLQLKDTPGSINKTVRQVKSGKYAAAKLVGTKETTKAYSSAAKGVSKQMNSSGISSQTTSRVADKALGKGLTKIATKRTLSCAGAAGGVAAALEAATSAKSLIKGEITGTEYATRVAKEGVGGAIAGVAAEAAATAATAAATAVLATTSAPVWVPIALGVGAAVAVGSGVKMGYDKLTKRITGKRQPSRPKIRRNAWASA